jgi:PAS domain S-box-containing protein
MLISLILYVLEELGMEGIQAKIGSLGWLSEQIEQKDSIINGISDALMLLDADTYEILEVNRAFLDSYRVSRADVLGKRCFEVTHHLDRPCHLIDDGEKCPLKESLETGRLTHVEHLHRDREGRELYFEITAYPVRDPEGRVSRIVHLSRDVTERKRAEDLLKESSQKMKFFAYSIAHDLKGPTVSIHGLTKRLQDHYQHVLDEKGKAHCQHILKAAEDIAELVENLNTYVSTKETPLSIAPIDPATMVRTLGEEYSEDLRTRGISWVVPDDIPMIKADRTSLVRAMRNLIDNALKYGGHDLSAIEIGYEDDGDSHVFTVSDNGVGLGVEEVEKIFDPFERKSRSSETEGSGLGLAIVREIAEHHGGKAWAKPKREKGTAFYLSISKDLVTTSRSQAEAV